MPWTAAHPADEVQLFLSSFSNGMAIETKYERNFCKLFSSC